MYAQPDAAVLKAHYPAFAAVADETVELWLTNARLTVRDSWIEADRAPAEMLLAAHRMAKAKVPGLVPDAVGAIAAAGVTSFRSASFSASVDSSTAARLSGGGYGSTDYGAEFAIYLRRNNGGPRLVGWC